MAKRFFISTPIYYPSGKPHIGHAYSTILADVMKRYKKLLGYETFFITGTDEHGKKIETAAKKANLDPLTYVTKNVEVFEALWKQLGIDYDRFIRTTEKGHMEAVQNVFSQFYQQDLIYLSQWTGWYCVSCEENYALKDAKKVDDKYVCQHGHELVEINESSYFFKMNQFQDWIKETLSQQKEIKIYPQSRVNELMNNFLSDKLTDLSVSRTSFSWGIQIKENPEHVIYVWMDALMNYITGLGYGSNDQTNYQKFWGDKDCERVHLLSKEITRFHCIYWPIFLHALNLPLPTTIISHGWITTPEGKMSKSLGNVIDPVELLKTFNREILRYYFIKDMSLESDNVFSLEALIGTYNGDLANNYGNLISRSLGMLKKYCNNVIPKYHSNNTYHSYLDEVIKSNERNYQSANALDIQSVLKEVQNLINQINKLIEDTKPWELFKNNETDKINDLMYVLFKVVEVSSFWLSPILIDSMAKVKEQTNIDIEALTYEKINQLDSISNITCGTASPIFERIKVEELEKK